MRLFVVFEYRPSVVDVGFVDYFGEAVLMIKGLSEHVQAGAGSSFVDVLVQRVVDEGPFLSPLHFRVTRALELGVVWLDFRTVFRARVAPSERLCENIDE